MYVHVVWQEIVVIDLLADCNCYTSAAFHFPCLHLLTGH
ncbi:MAG: SWIM zinc finger family protein [Prevotella histicola]